MTERFKRLLSSKWTYLAGGLLLGAFIILAIRYATYQPHETHYHANMAVFINGEREEFKGQQFYQEVKVCSLGGASPAARVHLHNNENGIVHVHDEAVTWGQFFANLGWTIGPDFIRTQEGLFVAEDETRLHIILNGENLTDISSIANQTIGDKDRLLVSYGQTDEQTLQKQFKQVADTAGEYNSKPDPASCGGAHGASPAERLKHLF